MTTEEKESRIRDLGPEWIWLMDKFKANVALTEREKQEHYAAGIALAKEHYYGFALSVLIEAAERRSKS
jgi:hypothetical protein